VYTFEYQAHPDIDQIVYMDAWKKYHKTACTGLPEDENLIVGNMWKTIELNQIVNEKPDTKYK